MYRWMATWAILIGMTAIAGADEVDFARDIRPIFSEKCYACHGPDPEQRQGGLEESGGLRFDTKEGAFADLGGSFAVVPGKPDESELIRRIQSTDESEAMPPADHPKQLTPTEKQLLVEWVTQGAEWKDHWAYVLPQRHPSPAVDNSQWVSNFVDAFVMEALERQELDPAPPADRRILLRRLSFDLTGLPPEPADVEAFVADDSVDAWGNAVDRLLASPHFGERMAIYWLDLVRYADTVGYHGDQDVSVSPYRDYVINAFNSNMPFDQFTREQLAGDLLQEPTNDQLVASGYNKLGMMSAEGGVQPKEYLAKYAADRVRTASAVWLGSTMGCCECHSHKFDPFTITDFYRFASFFADIKERGLYSGANSDGNWGPYVSVADDILAGLLQPIDDSIAALQKTIDTPTDELAAAQQKWEDTIRIGSTVWHTLVPDTAVALHKTKLTIAEDGSVLASGANPDLTTYTVTTRVPVDTITGLRLEVLTDDSLPQNGPGRAANGNFVVSELRLSFQKDAAAEPQPLALQNATATIEQDAAGASSPYKRWSAASAIDNDVKGSTWGWAILPEAGKPQAMVVELKTPLKSSSDGTLTVVIEQNHTNPKHTLGRFRLSVVGIQPVPKATSPTDLPQSIAALVNIPQAERADDQSRQLATHYRSVAPSLDDVRGKLKAKQEERKAVVNQHTRTSLITATVEPREMRVLKRGDWMDMSGQVVKPGVPNFLRQIRGDDAATRLDLSDWLTSADNPLTARVFVNRLWKLYFGTGLSKVLDDIGAQGEPPTHPELLDTLAVEFIESGWNIKHMVRLIVMSSAYRQSSIASDQMLKTDPYNRLLARQSRFRLDAELIRDNALAVSGLLVRKVGGRSVKPYQPAGLYRHLNFPRRTYQQDTGDSQYRRGLYTHWQRQFLHPAMKAFDAPSREECTAERPRSNTPLAALVLLNDPSYVEAARVFAARALQSTGDSDNNRLGWMMRQALSREPQHDEERVLIDLLNSQRQQYADQPDEARKLTATGLTDAADTIEPAELAAWTVVARAIFNMHEFVTRN
jgi:mono/diheme cytochrome c family protein